MITEADLLSRIDDLEKELSARSRVAAGQIIRARDQAGKIRELEARLKSSRKKYHGQVTARRGLELALLREKAVNHIIAIRDQEAHREAREGIRA